MKNLLKKESGFTLIEIVVVLAIAALILVIVIAAVGNANRARRDTQRVNDAGIVAGALEQYASANNGLYPGGPMASTFFPNNMKDVDTAAVPGYSGAVGPATAISGVVYHSVASGTGFICTAGAAAAGTTARQWAITYWSEASGTTQCRSNQ